jgi:CheY-like chemotaxis protein
MMDRIPVVLVAEDDPAISGLIQLCLQRLSCVVRRVENGRACLDSVQRERPDLILMDVMMPVMDGYTAATILSQDPATSDIPVIVLTAKKGVKDAFHSGNVIDFMEKPFEPSDLVARVHGVLSRRAV